MTMDITLEWTGPFDLASHDHRAVFVPPPTSGVYLWTVAHNIAHRVSYVGEASNLAERLYQHVYSTLGGAYSLYDEDHLLRGIAPDPVYRPSQVNLFTTFLDEFDRLSGVAFRNLVSYRFWWATVGADRPVRKAIESALIAEARKRGEPLQNEKRSRLPNRSVRLKIRSIFQSEGRVAGVGDTIEYGELDGGI